MNINLNNNVKVKLTQYGKEILKHNHQELSNKLTYQLGSYKEPTEDSEGYVQMQLWVVMSTFGPYLSMSGTLPIDTEIVI